MRTGNVHTLLSLRDSPHYMKVLAIFVVTSFLAIFTTTVVLSQYLANYMTTNMMMITLTVVTIRTTTVMPRQNPWSSSSG